MNPAAPSPSDSSIAQAFRDYQAKWPGDADTGMAGWIERRAREIDDSAPAAAVGGDGEDKGYWIVEKSVGHTRIYNAATGDSCEIECGDESPHAEILRQLADDAKEWGRPRAFITGAKIIDGVHVIIAKPTSDLLPEQLLVRYDDYLSKPTPAAPVGGFVVPSSDSAVRQAITWAIGFDFEKCELQTVNADDLMRLARAFGAGASPSYQALLIIARSVCGALERAGITNCDDPGEAIDILAQRAVPAAQPSAKDGVRVEDMHDDLSTSDLLAEAERIAANQHKDGRYAAALILRILCHRLGSQGAAVDGWDAQAYATMRDEVESWKQRALTAEADIQRMCDEFNDANGPTHMGEPVLPDNWPPSFHDIHKRGCHSLNPKYTVAEATTAAGLVDDAMVERLSVWLLKNAVVIFDQKGRGLEASAYNDHARAALEAAIGREVAR